VGEVGPYAPAVGLDWVDVDHAYFRGLYENASDYLTVLVQRRHRVSASPSGGRALMRLETGEPLLIEKPFGRGRVLLCTTGSSPRWSKLPTHPLFLPMIVRVALEACTDTGRSEDYLTGAQVLLRAEAGAADGPVTVTLPGGGPSQPVTRAVELERTAEGPVATFTETHEPGLYRWEVGTGAEPADAGVFAVNPHGGECDLRAFDAAGFTQAMRNRGLQRVFVGLTRDEALAAAREASQGRNWWDLLIATVVFLLVVEAVVSNRRGAQEDAAALPVGA
jgi:hypothetical protein